MADQEIQQWDLTEVEKKELYYRNTMRWGIEQVLSDFVKLRGEYVRSQAAWWDEFAVAHNIPAKYRTILLASEELGKVWVKGQVPDLDNMAAKLRDGF